MSLKKANSGANSSVYRLPHLHLSPNYGVLKTVLMLFDQERERERERERETNKTKQIIFRLINSIILRCYRLRVPALSGDSRRLPFSDYNSTVGEEETSGCAPD